MVLIAVIVSLEEGQSERRVDPHVVGRTPSRNSEGSGGGRRNLSVNFYQMKLNHLRYFKKHGCPNILQGRACAIRFFFKFLIHSF